MSDKEIENLLDEARGLVADYDYVCFKTPVVLRQLQELKISDDTLKNELLDAISELGSVEQRL